MSTLSSSLNLITVLEWGQPGIQRGNKGMDKETCISIIFVI